LQIRILLFFSTLLPLNTSPISAAESVKLFTVCRGLPDIASGRSIKRELKKRAAFERWAA
jgi:hypothetical protein